MRDRYGVRLRFAARLFVVGALIGVGACSLVVDAGRHQCAKAADCDGHGLIGAACVSGICQATRLSVENEAGPTDNPEGGPPADPIWGCLGGKVIPPPDPDKNSPAVFPAQFISNTTGAPQVGIQTKACEDSDLDCTTPLSNTSILSDDDGKIKVPVYRGFRGYIKLTPNAAYKDLFPTLLPTIPIPDGTDPFMLAVWPIMSTKDDLTIFATSSGGGIPKDEYGHIVFIVHDCSQRKRAEGVTAVPSTRTDDSYTFYTDNSVQPSIKLTATSKAGVVGFMNLPPGPVQITMRRENVPGDEGLYGVYDFTVRAGTLIAATPVPK